MVMKAHRHFNLVSRSPQTALARLSRRVWAGTSSNKGLARDAARLPEAAFEVLESRTLLSASPALVTLRADAKEIKADYVALSKADTANLKLITADLKAANLLQADKVALNMLVKGDAAALKLLKNDLKRVMGTIGREASSLDSDGHRLLKPRHGKATSNKLYDKVKAEIATLSTHAADGLTTLTDDAKALVKTDAANSSALASANPNDKTLSADVTAAQNNLLSAFQTLDDIVTKTLTTDVNSLIGLYSNIPIEG